MFAPDGYEGGLFEGTELAPNPAFARRLVINPLEKIGLPVGSAANGAANPIFCCSIYLGPDGTLRMSKPPGFETRNISCVALESPKSPSMCSKTDVE